MKRKTRHLGRVAVAVAVLASGLAVAGAGGETAMDKYQALLREKRALHRENWMLSQEANLAATKNPYILLDLERRELDFRIRGKTLKSYNFIRVSDRERGAVTADAEVLWRMVDGPLTLREKEGGRPEIIPPDPNFDGEEPSATEGEVSDAALLGVEALTDYFIKFEEDVVFHVRTDRARTFREIAVERLGAIAEAVGSLLTRGPGEEEPRLSLYLTTDERTARHLYHSLLPGERLFVTPPAPPPVVLVAENTP